MIARHGNACTRSSPTTANWCGSRPISGAIHRIADISASQGHIVPTAIAGSYGNFFVGNLNTFPIVEGLIEGPEDHADRSRVTAASTD